MLLDLRLYILIGTLVIYGLSVPFVSRLMLIGLLAFGVLWSIVSKLGFLELKISKSFLVRFGILIAFCLVYYGLAFEYNIFPIKDCLISGVSILAAYLLGYLLNYRTLPQFPHNIAYILLALSTGGALFVFLSVNLTLGGNIGAGIPDRYAQNFWHFIDASQRPVFGPSLDIYNALGGCMLPLLLWGYTGEISKKSYLTAGIWGLGVGAIALFSSIALQGRKPLLAFLLAGTIGYFLSVYRSPKDLRKMLIPVFTLGGIGFLVLILVSVFSESADQFLLFQRFSSEGLETPRYLLWVTVLEELPDFPFGGQLIKLPLGEEHAHNIWLDSAYDAGIPAFVLLVSFHLSHVLDTLSVIFSKRLPLLSCLAIMFTVLGFLVPFQVEPIMHSSTTFFALSFFFLGLVSRLAEGLRRKDP